MPISLLADTSTHLPLPHSLQQTALPASGLLSEEEADRLLSNLVQARWRRLECQDADPLGMLFNDRAKQWTIGWEPQEQALLLLVWETDSWQNTPTWSLYRNGALIFQATEGQSLQRKHWFSQLLESPHLPTITPTEFLARLHDFRYAQEAPLAMQQILQTMRVWPDLLETIQGALLDILEADLGKSEWPTLEVLKLHRLNHKTPIISAFQDWIQQGLITQPASLERLQPALQQLQQDYLTLGQSIQPLFHTSYQKDFQEFRALMTYCLWRLYMLKTPIRQQAPLEQSSFSVAQAG